MLLGAVAIAREEWTPFRARRKRVPVPSSSGRHHDEILIAASTHTLQVGGSFQIRWQSRRQTLHSTQAQPHHWDNRTWLTAGLRVIRRGKAGNSRLSQLERSAFREPAGAALLRDC